MIILHALRDFLDQYIGENNWKVRHAIDWMDSSKKAKSKKLDPKKGWAVSILLNKKTGEWSMPQHAVANQLDLIDAIQLEFPNKFSKALRRAACK